MQENPNDPLEGASHDELSACIQLLALSVAQHRAKCGFVTVRASMEQLRSDGEEAQETGLLVQGNEVLEEALELVRTLAAEPASALLEGAPSSDPWAEKRGQLRISVTAPIKVLWPGEPEPVAAKLENISWGGAAIRVNEVKTEAGDTVQIILPSTQGDSISIKARILRTWDLPDNTGHGLATRFFSLSTRDEAELENVLELLAQSADSEGQRKHARLTQRLDIQFDGIQELQATLDDISAGGLGITVPDPLQIGQSLQAVISTLDERCSLKLRARVVRQKPIQIGRAEFYHVGLKFEHPTEELNERTNELIGRMAKMRHMTDNQDC